ncbi:MAG: glycine oxidase ThiO [candidate division NC10 bacterium]|nr:glycine oxidase ThiO [candidate division NC10 bacterium]
MKTADVLIIGGGIIGCSIALELARARVRVLLLERDRVGCEASGEAAGYLAPQAEGLAPGPFLDLCLKSREMFGPLQETLREETGIDIEYLRSGALYLLLTEEDEAYGRRLYAEQRDRGLRVEQWDRQQVLEAEPHVTPAVRGALYLPDDHQVQNARMVRALVLAGTRHGAQYVEGSPVTGVVRKGDRVTGVRSVAETYHAGKVVIAAGAWSGTLGELVRHEIPIRPARGQLLSLQTRGDVLRHILFGREAYLVPRANGEVAVGSTVEFVGFDKHVTAAGIEGLLTAARKLVPALASRPMLAAWAGFRPWTPDELPFLGAVPGSPGLYIASGHFRKGILLAPITGHLMAELLRDQEPSLPFSVFRLDR